MKGVVDKMYESSQGAFHRRRRVVPETSVILFLLARRSRGKQS